MFQANDYLIFIMLFRESEQYSQPYHQPAPAANQAGPNWVNAGNPQNKNNKFSFRLMLHYTNSVITFIMGFLIILYGFLTNYMVFPGSFLSQVSSYLWLNIQIGIITGLAVIMSGTIGLLVRGSTKMFDMFINTAAGLGLIIVGACMMVSTNPKPSGSFAADYTASLIQSNFTQLQDRYNQAVDSGSHKFAFGNDKIQNELSNTFAGSISDIGMGIWNVKNQLNEEFILASDAKFCTDTGLSSALNKKFGDEICMNADTDNWYCPARASLCLNNVTLRMLDRHSTDGLIWIIAGLILIANAAFGAYVCIKLNPRPKESNMLVARAPQHGSTGRKQNQQKLV